MSSEKIKIILEEKKEKPHIEFKSHSEKDTKELYFNINKAFKGILENEKNEKNEEIILESVKDVHRGYVKDFKTFDLEEKEKNTEEKYIENSKFKDKEITEETTKDKNIVLILESPHKDEYTDKKPIAPAQGKTGENLKKFMEYALKKISEKYQEKYQEEYKKIGKKKYNLIICNPVQYQTSLASHLKDKAEYEKIKKEVWHAIWDYEDIQSDFKKRIKGYDPLLIIEACTGGKDDKFKFKKKIWYALEEVKNKESLEFKIFSFSHPSTVKFSYYGEK